MKIIVACVVWLSLAVCGCSNSPGDRTPSACGVLGLQKTALYPKITNGTVCSNVNSPVVQVTVLYSKGATAVCSGSLISPTAILTAAHCFIPGTGYTYQSSSALVEGRDHEITRVVVHPNADVPQNDAAVVFLAQAVSAPTLPLAISEPLQPGNDIAIFGYGVDSEGVGGVLRSGVMSVSGLSSQDIQAIFNDGSSSVCYGDSGGPAVFSFDDPSGNQVTGIVGIASFTNNAGCVTGSSAFFANTQSVSIFNFIKAVVPGVGMV